VHSGRTGPGQRLIDNGGRSNEALDARSGVRATLANSGKNRDHEFPAICVQTGSRAGYSNQPGHLRRSRPVANVAAVVTLSTDPETRIRQLIARNIRLGREQAGISQGELARRLRVDRQVVSRWENQHRNPKLAYLLVIGDLLDLPIEFFFQDHDDRP
jgi:DNA-binding XRE family transcriptional regulator